MGLGSESVGGGYLGSFGGEDPSYTLGDFGFRIENIYGEKSLRVSVDIPKEGAFLGWTGRIRILMKQGEYPRGPFDGEALLVADEVYEEEGTRSFTSTDLAAGETYYYSLYEYREDGAWVHDPQNGRVSQYPYGRWGIGDYLYSCLPSGWRSEDTRVGGDLRAFVEMVSLLFEGAKTEAENLLSLFSVTDIDETLLPLLDDRIGWPTWETAPGKRKREDTLRAVPWNKKKGTDDSYASLLGEILGWEATPVEGWRFVMFSNGEYGSKTPDFSGGNGVVLREKMGTDQDLLKYCNDTVGWHGMTGIGIFLQEVIGIGDAVREDALDRARFVLEKFGASYANFELLFYPVRVEEGWGPALEEWSPWEDILSFAYAGSADEDAGATSDCSLFLSTTAGSVTTDSGWRTYHEEIEYV